MAYSWHNLRRSRLEIYCLFQAKQGVSLFSNSPTYQKQGEFTETLRQFSGVINAPGASREIKAEAYENRASLYQVWGKAEKADRDRQFAAQLRAKV